MKGTGATSERGSEAESDWWKVRKAAKADSLTDGRTNCRSLHISAPTNRGQLDIYLQQSWKNHVKNSAELH